jgi:hypothetical protein
MHVQTDFYKIFNNDTNYQILHGQLQLAFYLQQNRIIMKDVNMASIVW